MSKLIALIDGSIYSRSVCDHAAWLAGRLGASVELLHVLGRRETASAPADLSGSIALGARTALLEELSALDEQRAKLAQQRGRAILEDAKSVLEAAGVADVAARLRFGDVVETVTAFESDAELVAIGKRGEAADFAKLHLGSNLERVVRSISKPAFVASRAFQPIRRFLIAYDGGPSCMKAVDYVARSPVLAGLPCRLVSVDGDGASGRRKLDAAHEMLRGGGFDVETSLLSGQPDAIISRIVENEGMDLLVMGAYGHSRIRNLIIGSTTSEMIRSCKIPIMLFR